MRAFLLLCACCLSARADDALSSTNWILLPALAASRAPTGEVSKAQAEQMTSDYFERFISLCGVPDTAEDMGAYWSSKLWGGYSGTTYFGTLWIRKSDAAVFLEPPKNGKLPFGILRMIKEPKGTNALPAIGNPALPQPKR